MFIDKRKITVFGLSLFTMILMIACEKNPATPEENPEQIVETNMKSGWENMGNGSYSDALSNFESVLQEDSTNAEANAGAAWSHARLQNIDDSQSYVDAALRHGYDQPDIYVLSAALALVHGAHTSIIEMSAELKDVESDWVFTHDPSVEYQDYLLLKAIAHFHLVELGEVQEVVNLIDDTLNLDANDASTWRYHDTEYNTFESLLLTILSDLI